MVVQKRTKKSRQRGSWTHGWGAKKKHRGSGHRGGRGMAGTGKRADTKKPSIWKDKDYFGKRGFKKKGVQRIIHPINVGQLDQHIEKWVVSNEARKEKEEFHIDLGKVGYNKLLGDGKVTKKIRVKVASASARAVEKIKAAGGDVALAAEE